MQNRTIKCWNCGTWNTIDGPIVQKCEACQQFLEKNSIALKHKKRKQHIAISKKNKTIFSVKKTDPNWLKSIKTVFRKINITFFSILLILTFLILLTHA
jgi:hypothetical protein